MILRVIYIILLATLDSYFVTLSGQTLLMEEKNAVTSAP